MRSSHVVTKWVAVLGLCGLAGAAMAQGRGRGGGPRMSPEDAQKVWGLQAAAVASSLDLADDAKTKVTDIYKKAREAQNEAMREAMSGDSGGPGGRFQAMRELGEKHAAGLKTALTEAIGEENGAKAAEQLAAFDRQSDGMALALSALGLEDSKMNDAMGLIGTYAADSRKAMEKAMAAMDMEGMRTARRELRTKLDDGMAKVLNEDQLAKWKEATAFRGGRGGRGGGRFGGPPGGGDNQN